MFRPPARPDGPESPEVVPRPTPAARWFRRFDAQHASPRAARWTLRAEALAGPRARDLERNPEPTSVLLAVMFLAALAWGFWGQGLPPAIDLRAERATQATLAGAFRRPAVATANASTTLPAWESAPASALLRWADDPRFEVRRRAVAELGRRGALGELNHLRAHPRADVRAAVPLAFLAWGPAAHQHIPWLAEGLASPDEAVRQNTMTALARLASAHGPYRPDAAAAETDQALAAGPRAGAR